MKKYLIIILITLFMFVGLFILTGCGENENVDVKKESNALSKATTVDQSNFTFNTEVLQYEKKDKKIIVKIQGENLDYAKSPWVGIVPVGSYEDSAEAKAFNVVSAHINAENIQNIELNIEGVAKGEWLLILCADNTNGKILASMPIVL